MKIWYYENMKMCESAALLLDAAIALNMTSSDAVESYGLEEMLIATIKQFSEFLESRGDEWNWKLETWLYTRYMDFMAL